MRLFAWSVVLLGIEFIGATAAPGIPRPNSLIVVAVTSDRSAAQLAENAGRLGHKVTKLPATAIEAAGLLKAEIEDGHIAEDGPSAPAHLDAFSSAVLKAIPDLFDYRRIRVVSEQIIPLEMVRRGTVFLGDFAEVSHVFSVGGVDALYERKAINLPLSRYAIAAVIGMPRSLSRAEQDIIKVALKLEREIPVELNFGGGADALANLLTREDVSILHIDTHGSPGGKSIQVSRTGTMLAANDIPATVRVPIVLLFGCEGVGGRQAFGAVLNERGAAAVISSFAKFKSFGLTGDPAREHLIYEALFSSLRAGQTVGEGLVQLRQVASREGRASSRGATLTRLMFVLVGRDDIAFAWPNALRQ